MVLSPEDEALISIIITNQRRIEEILKAKKYDFAGEQLLPKDLHVPLSVEKTTSGNVTPADPRLQTRQKSLILTSLPEYPAVSESVVSIEPPSESSNVIVDHPVAPPTDKIVIPPDDENVALVDIGEKTGKQGIPGLDLTFSAVDGVQKWSAAVLDRCSGSERSSSVPKVSRKKVSVIRPRDPRRKFPSSSSLDDVATKPSQPVKRKRCTSSSSIFDSNPNRVCTFTSDNVGSKKEQPVNMCEPKLPNLTESPTMEQSLQTSLGSPSEGNPRKRKTKILRSPLRNGRFRPRPGPGSLKQRPSSSGPARIEPHVSCWANCPIREHIFPRNRFIEHLTAHHGADRHINMMDKQIVCTCYACQSVVDYNYPAKFGHLDRCTGGWQQQFYLFVENVRDQFAIEHFNAPTTINHSTGGGGTQSSSAHHPHLDTLTWRNVKMETFFYHFCSSCRVFIEDDQGSVANHTSSTLHRINFRNIMSG